MLYVLRVYTGHTGEPVLLGGGSGTGFAGYWGKGVIYVTHGIFTYY